MILPEVTTLAEARDAIRDLAEEVEKLSNELAWFKRQMFGSKTEHYIPEDNTPSLFPEEESPEPSKEVQTATVLFLVNSHSKKSLFLLTMGLAGRIRINTTPASQIDSLLPQNWDLQPTLKYPGKATQTRL